jgi:precorrin-3B synthase
VGCRPVEAHQWRAVAELADGEGNGQVEFTSRGNLQLRGLRRADIETAATRLVACGLAGRDADLDRRRAVVRHPLLDLTDDPGLAAERRAVVDHLEALLEVHGGGLPAKWWVYVDTDLPFSAPRDGADVTIISRSSGWEVQVTGSRPIPRLTSTPDPVGAIAELIDRCATAGCRARDLEARCDGQPSLSKSAARNASGATSIRAPWWGLGAIGPFVVAGATPVLGLADAASLHTLSVAAADPLVSVRPTPQRGVVVVAPAERRATVNRVLDALAVHGWVTRPDDPRRFVTACIGARGCPSGLVDTHALAADLNAAGTLVEPVHLSGCPKRCGSPPGARELIATADGLVESTP